jgi:hypothetical protein
VERWVPHTKVVGGRAVKTKRKVLCGNPRFTAWKNQAGMEVLQQKRAWPVEARMALPLKGDLRLEVLYCPQDKTPRDIPGMVDALFHLLEAMEIVEDDAQVKALRWTPGATGCVTMKLESL